MAEDCRLLNDGSEESFEKLNRVYERVYVVSNPQAEIIIAIVVAIAVAVLVKPPEIPAGSDQPLGSPNNSPNSALSPSTNQARLLQRIPEIFGEVQSYPDLIAPSVEEYFNNRLRITEYFCIGRGFYDIQNFRRGDVLLDDIPDTVLTEYEPGVTIPDLKKTLKSGEVDDVELTPPNSDPILVNDIAPSPTVSFNYGAPIDPVANLGNIYVLAGGFDGLNDGDQVVLSNFDVIADNPTQTINLDGTYTIYLVNGSKRYISLQDAHLQNANWSLIDGFDNVDPSATTASVQKVAGNVPFGPYIVPGDNYDEIWADVEAPAGVDTGSYKNITIEFLVEEIDALDVPTGPSFTVNEIIGGTSNRPVFRTRKIDSGDGVVKGNRYRVTVTRTTNQELPATGRERMVLTRIASVEVIDGSDSVGVTRASVEITSSDVLTRQTRGFNADVTRKVVTWNGSSVVGDISTGVGLAASRKFSDAMLHYFLDTALKVL
jgi:hypothetical protein